MSCSKLKKTAHLNNDVAFLFNFSRGANLALRAVDIKDGKPKLRFSPAQNVPALTEEDVAVIAKLCTEGKRPGFFYEGFHLFHPFFDSGRLFKGYRPRYLRDTSIGETLAEADWAMKCLHVGVRSDKDKKVFTSWKLGSNLQDLRTREDFDENVPGATIVMRCQSVDVDKEQPDELYFVGEPKMRIDCVVDGCNTNYSKYITQIFDSVAYHDEHLFQKVKEIIKLVYAMEWLKERLDQQGMCFSESWIQEHLNKRQQRQPAKPIAVKVPQDEVKRLVKKSDITNKQLALPGGAEVKVVSEKRFKTGIEIEAEATYTSKGTPMKSEAQIRKTYNDYDFLLKDLDPNQPTDIDEETGEFLRPNVKDWNELFNETVPAPCTAIYTAGGAIGPPVTGGVSTRSFETNHVRRTHTPKAEVTVPAGEKVRKNYASIPKPGPTVAPATNVGVNTTQSDTRAACREGGIRNGAGHTDYNRSSTAIWSENGQHLASRSGLKTRVVKSDSAPVGTAQQLPSVCPHDAKQLINGEETGVSIKLHMQLHPKGSEDLNISQAMECVSDSKGSPDPVPDSGYSSLRSSAYSTH